MPLNEEIGEQSTFIFRGQVYSYCENFGERAVEIPIIWAVVRQYEPAQILEVGNVLYQYRHIGGADWHTVVDKYELKPYVVNIDIVDYEPGRLYDLVVCISTLEHIGRDIPEVFEKAKPLRALHHMRDLLAPGGQLWVTVPLDYYLNDMIEGGEINFKETYFMKRLQKPTPPYTVQENRWVEATWDEVKETKYIVGPGAWGLLIGVDRDHG